MKTKEAERLNDLVLCAMFMGLVIVMTLIIRIPVPATQGYIHLGDSMIFLAVLMMGKKNGAVAAGVGSALADIIGGYAFYAPITLIVKALMAFVVGVFIEKALKRERSDMQVRIIEIIGMAIGGALMVAGYYIAESVMYGNFVTPLAGIGMNSLQFVVGIAIAFALARALEKTPLAKRFTFTIR